MKVLKPGHLYEVDMFENTPMDLGNQRIQFIEKAPSKTDPTVFETVVNGTTTEELLEVVINRLEYLNAAISCEENDRAIRASKEALHWLNVRTETRRKRDVEGKPIA
jgi:hypothetical protein